MKEHTVEQQEELCKELCSDNPLKFWDKDKIICKNYQDIQEFNKQIKELLDKGLIRNSRSPHTSCNTPSF